MKNLIIGNTSQLSYFFPDDFEKMSSRDIDFRFLEGNQWNDVYLCFGESRKFLQKTDSYDEINYRLTKEVIEILNNSAKKIVVYSTCELWNRYSGKISLSLPFDFYLTPYLESKYKLTKFIISNKKLKNTVIVFPFNYNSVHRSKDFLFGKIFDSIINGSEIVIGDTYFYRDIVHPKFVVNESLKCDKHKIIGSGRLTYVNDFIRDLYSEFGLLYGDYVSEAENKFIEYERRNEYYLKSDKCLYSYNNLLMDTCNEIYLSQSRSGRSYNV